MKTCVNLKNHWRGACSPFCPLLRVPSCFRGAVVRRQAVGPGELCAETSLLLCSICIAALCRFLGPRHGAAIALGQGAWTRAIAHGWGPEKHTRTFFGPMSMSLKTWIYDLFHVVPSLPSLRLMLSYFHVSLFIFAPQHMIASSNLCCKRARPLFM